MAEHAVVWREWNGIRAQLFCDSQTTLHSFLVSTVNNNRFKHYTRARYTVEPKSHVVGDIIYVFSIVGFLVYRVSF